MCTNFAFPHIYKPIHQDKLRQDLILKTIWRKIDCGAPLSFKMGQWVTSALFYTVKGLGAFWILHYYFPPNFSVLCDNALIQSVLKAAEIKPFHKRMKCMQLRTGSRWNLWQYKNNKVHKSINKPACLCFLRRQDLRGSRPDRINIRNPGTHRHNDMRGFNKAAHEQC